MHPIAIGTMLAAGIAFFIASMAHRLAPLWRVRKSGPARLDRPADRLIGLIPLAFGQKRLLFRDGRSGLMHAFIFWGFLVVSLGTLELFGKGLIPGFSLPLMDGLPGAIYLFTKDIFELLVLIGVAALLFRRIALRPKRLTLSLEADLILIAIALLMITDFLMGGAETATAWRADIAATPICALSGALLASSGFSSDALGAIYTASYFAHTGGILLFLNYLPYGKHFHIITAIPNVFLRRMTPAGALSKLDLEDESATTFGTGEISELGWKQMLDLMSCTECGRCMQECPATAAGKKLNPKELTIAMRDRLYARSRERSDETAIVPGVVDPEALWDCTTCRACEEACPVFIEYVDRIVEMRRNLVLMRGEMPAEAQTALRNIESNSNPWGLGYAGRGDWAKGLGIPTLAENRGVEYLFFVGCAGSYDERAKRTSRALVKCLQTAGVSFGILGAEEKCTGDSARRIGNEYLFQQLARENIATFDRYGVKKIITACPHCFNTLKNEFPQFGGRYDVFHHSEILSDLIASGKLEARKDCGHQRIAFHDSCYLGRYNGIYDAPRRALEGLVGLEIAEARLSKDRASCCGAGGGRMWMEDKSGSRINHARLAEIKNDTGAGTIAAACPFCTTMLSDAIGETGAQGMEVKDIAELVAERI